MQRIGTPRWLTAESETAAVTMPHLTSVLALCFLSAYLIVWKPQKRAPPGRDLDRRHGLVEDSKTVAPNSLFHRQE
jgi:hypothetical protein